MAEVGSWVWLPDDIGKDYVVPGQVLAITADGIKAKLENGQVINTLIINKYYVVIELHISIKLSLIDKSL